MDHYDPKLAERVWQRVQGGTEGQLPSLLPMIAGALEDSAVLQLLSKRFRGSRSLLLKQLSQQAQGHAACMKGIHRLRTGSHAQAKAPKPAAGITEALLMQCYTRLLQAHSHYRAWEQDPEYGHVFARLARESQTASRSVLQILGSLPAHAAR